MTAVERWRALTRARAEQMDAAYVRLGRTSHDFWHRRAAAFHKATRDTAERDPIFPRLRAALGDGGTFLDVGAGTGRFTMALAPFARQVTAVEPNERMRGLLQEEARERGLANVGVVPTTWEDAPETLSADVVLCAHVLYPVHDVAGFLLKLDRATHGRCFVYMRARHPDAVTSPIWEHFHGEPRRVAPTYIAAVDVLEELGIFADVEIVPHRPSWRWDTLDDAVDEQLESFILPDTPEARAELRRVLQDFLVERDGQWTLPVDNLPNAILSWTPDPDRHR